MGGMLEVGMLAFSSMSIAEIGVAAMTVGTITGVVGAVTGNKTLTQIGMGLGLAGGLTSLAGASGFFSGGDMFGSGFGTANIGADEAAQAAAMGGPGGGSVASDIAGGALPTPKVPMIDMPSSPGTPIQSSDLPGGGIIQGPAEGPTAPPGTPPFSPTQIGSQIGTAPGAPTAPTANKPAGSGWPSWGTLSNDDKWKLAATAAQVGGGLLQGYQQGLSASEKLEFEKMVNQQQQTQKASTPGLIQFRK